MSGHSKWSKIKHKKGIADTKRGHVFTKLGKAITIAVREGGGGDIDANFSLRLAVDKAKKGSMPSLNIERAIKKGTGDLVSGAVLEKAVYGGYWSDGVAILVDVFTDNKNRIVSSLRKIFSDHGGRLAEASSVLWQFHERGRILVKCAQIKKGEKFGDESKEVEVETDKVIMAIMDIDGVIDVGIYKGSDVECDTEFALCTVITKIRDLDKISKQIAQLGYILDTVKLARIPENTIQLNGKDKDKVISLITALQESDDVEDVWDNANLSYLV